MLQEKRAVGLEDTKIDRWLKISSFEKGVHIDERYPLEKWWQRKGSRFSVVDIEIHELDKKHLSEDRFIIDSDNKIRACNSIEK